MTEKADVFAFKHERDPDTGWLSQWFDCEFKDEDGAAKYCSAEQYMMTRKARLFKDKEAEAEMWLETNPKQLQTLGRNVANFDQNIWDKEKELIVETGNYLKFRQNPALRARLLATGEKILAETLVIDRIWACGVASTSPNLCYPARWPGRNLLGYALMRVRTRLRGEAGG